MAGIVKENMQQKPPEQSAQPQPAQPGTEAQPAEQEGLSPELQEAYERVVLAGMKALYDDSTNPAIMQALQGEGDPAQKIAQTTMTVMMELDNKSNGTIPPEIIPLAAIEILELVAELGEKAGFFQFDESLQARSVQALVALAVENGFIDEADLQELINSFPPEEVQSMVAQQEQYATAGQQQAPAQPAGVAQ